MAVKMRESPAYIDGQGRPDQGKGRMVLMPYQAIRWCVPVPCNGEKNSGLAEISLMVKRHESFDRGERIWLQVCAPQR
jgi:hypothetical protein